MSHEPEPRIKALLDIKRVDLIHNDLINAAFHLKKRIEKAIETDQRDGVGLDMMAAITMTAFAYEAYLNFIGHSVVKDWKERQPLLEKQRQIMATLGIQWNDDARPFSTIRELIGLRNTLGHGKPVFREREWESTGTHSELEAELRDTAQEWEKKITPEFVSEAYDDVDALWKKMLEIGNISVFERIDHGSSGIQFLSFAEQQDAKQG